MIQLWFVGRKEEENIYISILKKIKNYNLEKEALEDIDNSERSCWVIFVNISVTPTTWWKKHLNSKHEGHLICSICESKFSSADYLLASCFNILETVGE